MTFEKILKKAENFTKENPICDKDDFRIRRLKREAIRRSEDIRQAITDLKSEKNEFRIRRIERKTNRVASDLSELVDDLVDSLDVIKELS